MIFIDTNVAIDLRDRSPGATDKLRRLSDVPVLSFVTRIELEGGVHAPAAGTAGRRAGLVRLLRDFAVVALTETDALAYGSIVAACGFDRRRILDRLIAAQVLMRNAALLTANTADFADIQGLDLLPW